MKQYTIRQTFACDNKFEEMTQVRGGRHCGDCNKTVVDFTQMSDEDIVQYLLNNTHTCGLLKKNQVNRPIYLYNQRKKSTWPAIAAMLIAGLVTLASTPSFAGNTHPNTIKFSYPVDGKKVEPSRNEQKITVHIYNSTTNAPISYGMVYIDGVGYFYSDANGKAEIVINYTEDKKPENYYVTVSAGGYATKSYTIKEKELQKISGANIYMDVLENNQDEILPAGMIAIDVVDTLNKK